LRTQSRNTTVRDFPIAQTILPQGLRSVLQSAGLLTLGDLTDRILDRERTPIEAIAGIGPYRASLIRRLLDHHELLPGAEDLKAAVADIFPDLA
jgi:hypothetical protein